MKLAFYRFLTTLTRYAGPWVFRFFAWFIAAGYFLFFPGRVARSVRFYRILLPERGLLRALLLTWRQYQNFTSVFLDRFLFQERGKIPYDSEGFHYLEEAVASGRGGVLLMSHLGNWEVSAHLLKGKGMKLLLYVGEKHREQIERMQKQSLSERGIRLVTASPDAASPFDLVEAIRFLREGGLVSMTGDRLWHESQRSVPAVFADHETLLPETPHLFSLLSGAPILPFFVYRKAGGRYRIRVSPPWTVKATSRKDRDKAVRRSVQAYARILEEEARSHPDQWYHFEDFLGEEQRGGVEAPGVDEG
ncbi:MAG: lysophospholipid acyltransferase family protein [Syntrophaceae bacterium]|nr:lysophospholipid acyltransferase family protein [Syntrophaceae bacterium]